MTEPRYEVELRDTEIAAEIIRGMKTVDRGSDDIVTGERSFHATEMGQMDDNGDPAINFRIKPKRNVTVWDEDIEAIRPLEGQ